MVKELHIYNGREHFYQWDLNQRITSNNFAVGDEIHFFNMKQPTALVVIAYELDGKVVAYVPNILLQSSCPITVYRYINTDNDAHTIEEYSFDVKQRAKPDDYVYTETEIYTIKTAVDKALLEAKESGEFDGADGKDGKDGINGQDGKDGMDGVSCTHEWYGTTLTITSASGTSSSDLKGDNGNDYILTEADKEEISNMAKPPIDQTYTPESTNAQSGKAVSEAVSEIANQNIMQDRKIQALEDSQANFVAQTHYDPESPLAQSGIAVAEAVANIKPTTEEWEQIADTTIKENSVINITKDMSGNSFALKKFIIIVSKTAVEGVTATNYVWIKAKSTDKTSYTPIVAVEGTRAYADNVESVWRYEGEIKHAWQTTLRCMQNQTVNTIYAYGDYTAKYGVRSEFKNSRSPVTAFQFTWGYSGGLPAGTRVEMWGVKA